MPPVPEALTRLYVQDDLHANATLTLDTDRAHYLRHVLRLSEGQAVGVFNGRDGEWQAQITHFDKKSATLEATTCLRPQTVEPDLWLLFAPLKRGRTDFVAEKAGELGASALWPIFTRYTNAERVNEDRLTANATEAAEQCERLSVPTVFPPQALEKVLASWPADRVLYVCAEAGLATPITAAFTAAPKGPAAILIGPEGGFSPDEFAMLRQHPAVRLISLGPRILRADTAALSALACWQAVCGDWPHDRPPHRE